MCCTKGTKGAKKGEECGRHPPIEPVPVGGEGLGCGGNAKHSVEVSSLGEPRQRLWKLLPMLILIRTMLGIIKAQNRIEKS